MGVESSARSPIGDCDRIVSGGLWITSVVAGALSEVLSTVLHMAGSATPLAERRQIIAAGCEATRDLHTVGYQCPSDQLGELVGELAEMVAFGMAQLAAVVADAEARGVVEASQCASTAAWVAEYGWHLRRDAYTIAKAAKLLRRPDLTDVADSVLTADVDLGTAVVVAGEFDKLAPDLSDEAQPVILQQLLAVGADCGPSGVRRLKQELLARYGAGRRVRPAPTPVPAADRPVGRPGNLTRGVGLPAHLRQRRPRRPGSRHRTAGAPRVDKDADGRPSANPMPGRPGGAAGKP